MSLLVPTQLKRFFRLQAYFRPYPAFLLRIQVGIERISIVSKPTAGKRKFVVTVPASMLEDTAPESQEAQILKQVLTQATSLPQQVETKQLGFDFSSSPVLERQHVLTPALAPTITPQPSLRAIWEQLARRYFPDQRILDEYRVVWSKRKHTNCLASCNIERKRVLVASVMNLPECRPFLEALIYHEMCHAVLGPPKVVRGRRIVHGKEFKQLERLHPGIRALDTWIKAGGWHQAVRRHRYVKRQNHRELCA